MTTGEPIEQTLHAISHGGRRAMLRLAWDAERTSSELAEAAGTPQRIVMEMMGHSNYSMTTRYQHVPDALQREAADRLDELLQRVDG